MVPERDISLIDLTPLSAKAVLDEYGVLPEETVLQAAVQAHYNFMSGEPRFNRENRADNNRVAVEMSIQDLAFRLPALRAFASDFFGDSDYDHDAVTVAAVCDSALDVTSRDYDVRFFKNLHLIDPSLEDRAALIYHEAQLYVDEGLRKSDSPSRAGLFVAQLWALASVKHAIQDFGRGAADSEFIRDFRCDLLPKLSSLIVDDSAISVALYDGMLQMVGVYNKNHPTAEVKAFPAPSIEPPRP